MTKREKIISLFGFAIVLLGIVFLWLSKPKQAKLAYIDSAKLLNEYEGMKVARQQFQQETQSWKGKVDTLTLEIQQKIKSYEKEVASLSAKEKSLQQELIALKQKQLVDYQKAIQQKYQEKDQAMTVKVLTQVNTFLKVYGEKQGYDMIWATTQAGNIVYAKDVLDITQEVTKALNAQYKGQ